MTRARDASMTPFAVLLKTDLENSLHENLAVSQCPLHPRVSAILLVRQLADSDDSLLVFRWNYGSGFYGAEYNGSALGGATAYCFIFQRRRSLKPREAIEIPKRGSPP